jgi:hypothetical protein
MMVRTLKQLKKLRGRSVEELRTRGSQAFAAYAERSGFSSQARVPDDDDFFSLLNALQGKSSFNSPEALLHHFRNRTSPIFFAGFADREATIEQWRRRFERDSRQILLDRADRIIEGRFDLLGYRNLSFGSPIDWHLEPIANKRAPALHWSRIDYLDSALAGDKKIVWELNRHQYFATLGRAYWLTGDEKYSGEFFSHVASWMDANPPKIGINWASSLEISFRAISWIWALYFFKHSPNLTSASLLSILKFLYLHAKHLETYLSTYFSPNTHLTGEALGLYYLGTILPEFKEAAAWRATGRRILLEALKVHVRADGVYFEQSSHYHRYTTDFYTHLYILSHANGEHTEPELQSKLAALLDHLMHITSPDGATPLFGDDDGGRLTMLDQRAANDFRACLSTGAALLRRADYKFVASEAAEETLWLLGPKEVQTFDGLEAKAPASGSRAFDDGGYYVMRDGWLRDSNYMVMDCGPHGSVGGAHAHADVLSFQLASLGRTLLVDPGTFTYTGSSEARDHFRSTAAHNALVIDGESSSLPGGPFKWKQTADGFVRRWLTHPRVDFFEGSHEGYRRLDSPAIHIRSVLFLKGDYWVLRDRIVTQGSHHYDLRFHFSPDSKPVMYEHGELSIVQAFPGLKIAAFGSGGAWRREDDWVSSCYGERTPSPVYAFSLEGNGDQEFITFLMPVAREHSRMDVREVPATNGKAFEVDHNYGRDLVLIKDEGRVSAGSISSNADLTWIRFLDSQTPPEEVILIREGSLWVDEHQIFACDSCKGFSVGKRVDGQVKPWPDDSPASDI